MEKEKKKEKGEQKEEKQEEKHESPEKKEKKIQNIIRLGETNLDGTKNVESAILGVRGVSFSLAKAISKVSGFGNKKVGDLSEDELKKLEDMINHPEKHQIPSWLYNRRKDPETGEDKHLSVSQLEFAQKMDIGRVKKLKSYKGMRHITGLPVRGQRTRGSFRKGKVVGVTRKARAQRAAKSGK
jgi:small subunit ribosomal protein S13